MRAINLVPADARPGRVNGGKSGGAVYGFLGILVVLLAGLSLLAVSKRDQHQAEQSLASVQQSTDAYSQIANRYSSFESAATQATQRINVVRGLADARFDWAGSMRELSRLIPANTQVQTLDASVKPGAGSDGGSTVRGSIDTPAIAITACSKTQSTVANLVTNLQAMRRVTNVTLETSDVSDTSLASATSTGGSNGSSDSSGDSGDGGKGCTLPSPYYDVRITIFFAQGDAKAAADIAPSGSAATTISSEAAGGNAAPAASTPTAGN